MDEAEAEAAFEQDRERVHQRTLAYIAKHRMSDYEATKVSLVELVRRIGELICERASAAGTICWCTSLEHRKKHRAGFLFECKEEHSERHRLHVELKRHLARYRELREQYETQREVLRGLGLEE